MKRYNVAFYKYETFLMSVDVRAVDEADAVIQAKDALHNRTALEHTRVIITLL